MDFSKHRFKAVISSALVCTFATTLMCSSSTIGFASENADPVVSVVNFSPVWGDKESNISSMTSIVESAAKTNTDIIVFPEMAVTGYSSGTEYLDNSKISMPVELAESKSGKTAAYFSCLAEKYDMYIIYGAPETVEGDSTHAYNSAFVCTPDGKVDSYQKMLVADEGEWCTAGSNPVYFNTEFGKVALSVGDDIYDLVELDRIYAADNCFMIAAPTAIEAEDYTQSYDYSNAVYCDYTSSYYYNNWTDYNRNRIYNIGYMTNIYIASSNLIGAGGKDGNIEFGGGAMLVGMNSPEEYNKIWSMWKSLIGEGRDLVDYIMKIYAGSADSTNTLYTASINTSYASRELVDEDIYQPNLYAKWYAELADKGMSIATPPVSTGNPVVATVNMTPLWDNKAANTEEMINYMSEAYNNGVNIIVFPEMALADYAATSDPESPEWKAVVKNAESTDGEYATAIANAAKEYNMYVIYGTAEMNPNDKMHPYNSAFVATPEGKTFSYRKIQPVEGDWTTWGTEPMIVNTPWGGMGISICMDTYAFPELARYYAAAGCTMLINPTASTGYAGSNFIYNTAISTITARDNLALISSDLVNVSGYNDSMLYPGKSTIITTNGISPIFLTEESMTDETMYIAELDMTHIGFSLKGYNAKVMSKAYSKLAAGTAVYDYSGIVSSSDIEETTTTINTIETVSETNVPNPIKNAASATENPTKKPSSSTVDTVNSNGIVKTGTSAIGIALTLLLITASAVFAVFYSKKSSK